jgi:hypothetical protein
MSPHGQFLLEQACSYMARLIAGGMAKDKAAEKAADWYGFHPSTVIDAARAGGAA